MENRKKTLFLMLLIALGSANVANATEASPDGVSMGILTIDLAKKLMGGCLIATGCYSAGRFILNALVSKAAWLELSASMHNATQTENRLMSNSKLNEQAVRKLWQKRVNAINLYYHRKFGEPCYGKNLDRHYYFTRKIFNKFRVNNSVEIIADKQLYHLESIYSTNHHFNKKNIETLYKLYIDKLYEWKTNSQINRLYQLISNMDEENTKELYEFCKNELETNCTYLTRRETMSTGYLLSSLTEKQERNRNNKAEKQIDDLEDAYKKLPRVTTEDWLIKVNKLHDDINSGQYENISISLEDRITALKNKIDNKDIIGQDEEEAAITT